MTAAWQEPLALLERLDGLAAQPATGRWAAETARLVRSLGPDSPQAAEQATAMIRRLDALTAEVVPLAAELGPGEQTSELLRTGYALSRRLDVWREVVRIGPWEPPAEATRWVDPQKLSACLAEIDALTGDSAEGKAWHEYLLIEELREWAGQGHPAEGNPAEGHPAEGHPAQDRLPRALAEKVLGRLTRTAMTGPQRQFISSAPIAALRRELQRRTAEPVDPARLLRHLELYEQTELASDARRLAADCQDLGLSPEEDQRRLAAALAAHYRNANLRLAVTAELLNRMMPERDPEYASVRDRVLGVPVYGRSLTATDVSVRLTPDPGHVRMALEIDGLVASLTSSTSGPATFINNGRATYTARKPLQLDLEGVRMGPSEVRVYNRVRLRSLETDFDGIPLVGSLVKSIARSEHERNRPAASREIKRKIASRARERIDTEADARLGELSKRLQQRVLEPLHAMALDPTLVGSQTTQQRLTMRVRLAGGDQLGGHTPRPRAPSNSLVSFQVHQSAINNMLARLELDGRAFTLPELAGQVATRLRLAEPWETDPAHDDVKLSFAEEDALGLRLADGRVTLTLALAKLHKPPRRIWRDFRVRVVFRPEIDERSAYLVRDGIIHLEGQRLGARSRLALSGIFSQMFPRQRCYCLTPEKLAQHPKLADLQLTQFHIGGGWLGVAAGPKPPVQRTVRRDAK